MGTGFRVYVYEEDGTLTRIPHTDYVRLWNGIASKRLQRFAREEIRVAHTGVELRNRQVMDVTFVEFQKFRIDEHGLWPEAEKERHWRLSADSVGHFSAWRETEATLSTRFTGLPRRDWAANSGGSQLERKSKPCWAPYSQCGLRDRRSLFTDFVNPKPVPDLVCRQIST